MRSGSSIEFGPVGGFGAARIADRAVDDDVADMDALRVQFARHRLGEPSQRELAHGEGRRARVALHAGRGAGEEDGAGLPRQHAPDRLLRRQEGAEGGDLERLQHIRGRKLGKRAADAEGGIVDDDSEIGVQAVDRSEEGLDILRLRGVAGNALGAGLGRQAGELAGAAGGEHELVAAPCQLPGEGGGEAIADADDEGYGHDRSPFRASAKMERPVAGRKGFA